MRAILEDFRRQFGEEVLLETLERAGLHSLSPFGSGEEPPKDEEEKLIFSLLEILDFDCCKRGCYKLLTEDQIKSFLKKWRREILEMELPVPSFFGFFFSALLAEKGKDEAYSIIFTP